MKLPPIEKSPLTNYQYIEHVDTDLVMSILNQPELIQHDDKWDESQGLKKLLKFTIKYFHKSNRV